MPTCSKCHGWKDSEFHRCPPAWRVWNPEESTQEDAHTFYGYDADSAAEAWAERDDSDSAEYRIAQGSSVVVCVQRLEPEGPIERYSVTGEYEPVYMAEKVT